MFKTYKKFVWISSLILLTVFIAGCQETTEKTKSEAAEQTEDVAVEESVGGTEINIALDGQPPNLDHPTSASTSVRDTARLVFETLFTTDANFQPVPMLAESVETEDNETYTFHLREGVKFHNGKEMIAEDVIASMERWLEKSTITGTIFDGATWESPDDYTVVLQLAEPSSLLLDTIASSKQSPAIMPKEIVETAPPEAVEEYIGTGPYEFVEWVQDQYIHFTKYDGYQPLEDEANGLAGKKEALIEDIYFHIVPDTSTRLAGLQTGEYDFVYGIPYDSYQLVESNPDLQTFLTVHAAEFLVYNTIQGPVADFELREAINVALDPYEIMIAAFPDEDLFTLHSGYMDPQIENWASEIGEDYYNINDLEKAKELVEKSGYDGEALRLMTTRDYDHHYNVAIVIQEQLSNIGLNIELEVYDWPTINEKQFDQGSWDLYTMSFSTVSTPPQFLGLSPTWAAGVDDKYVHETMREIELAPTLEEAQKLWDELQLYGWEELLSVSTLGSFNNLFGAQSYVEGLETFSGPIFWNTKIAK